MVTRDTDLPVRAYPCHPKCGPAGHAGHCGLRRHLAGHGRSLDTAKAALSSWWAQLQRWNVAYRTSGAEKRLWYIVAQPAAGRQAMRLLPTQNRELIAYPPDRVINRTHARRGEQSRQGPYYVISFRDARALWADKHFAVRPAIDGEWNRDEVA